METAQGSATTNLRQPKYSISYIFQHVLANEQAASWLLSRDPCPPSVITGDMLKGSITLDAIVLTDPKQQVFISRRYGTTHSGNGASGSDRLEDAASDAPSSLGLTSSVVHNFLPFAPSIKPPDVEKVVWMFHGITKKYAMLTMADTRTPFAFLEPHGKLTPGVRRVVAEYSENGYTITHHYWLEDGRSTFLVCLYQFKPVLHEEKHMLLLAPYPSSRFPNERDVLESAIALEIPTCQFCLAYGFESCECLDSIHQRTKPQGLSTIQLYDVRLLWKWIWSVKESTLKKYHLVLRNEPCNVTTTSVLYSQLISTFGRGLHLHRNGFQSYLDCIAPFVRTHSLRNILVPAWENAVERQGVVVPAMTGSSNERTNHQTCENNNVSSQRTRTFELEKDVSPSKVEAPPSSNWQSTSSVVLTERERTTLCILGCQESGSVLKALSKGEPASSCQNQFSILRECPDLPNATHESSKGLSFNQSPWKPDLDEKIISDQHLLVEQYHGLELAAIPGPKISSAELFEAPNLVRGPECSPHAASTSSNDMKRKLPANERDGSIDGTITVKRRKRAESAAEETAVQTTRELLAELEQTPWNSGTRHPCKLCNNLSFTRKYDLKRHMISVHCNTREHECQLCNLKFSRRAHLNAHHQTVHLKVAGYPCFYCSKPYTAESTRRNHIKSAHPGMSIYPPK